MFDRDFETFLIKHVRRESAVYCGIMIALGGCALACIVMAFAAPIVFGIKGLSMSLKLLALGLSFTVSCYGVRSAVLSGREASREMTDGLENPECNNPADYSDETKAARRSACRTLQHIRGLIISYGILSLTLWAAVVLFFALAGIGTSDFSLMMLLVAFAMLAMALPLTILAIAYMMDLPETHEYRKSIDYVLMEEQTD